MRYAGWAAVAWLVAFVVGIVLLVLSDGLGVRWAMDIREPVGVAVFILGGATVAMVIVDQFKRGGK